MKKAALFMLLISTALTSCGQKVDYKQILIDWASKINQNENYNKDYKNSLLIHSGFLGEKPSRIIVETSADPNPTAALTFHSETYVKKDYYQCLSFTIYAASFESDKRTYASADIISKPYQGYDYQSYREQYKYFTGGFMIDCSSISKNTKVSYEHVYKGTITPTNEMINEHEQITSDLVYFTLVNFKSWIDSDDFSKLFPNFSF